MNNEEKILAILEQMQGDIVQLQGTTEQMQGNIVQMQSDISDIKVQQDKHTSAIMNLENSVTHELKLLRENLPNVIARHEVVRTLEATVDNHDHRIFALEQKISNG